MNLLNTTKRAFVHIGIFGVNFVTGYVEEIALNITKADPANAVDVISTSKIPDKQILIKKATVASLTSSLVKDKLSGIISKATFTGLL